MFQAKAEYGPYYKHSLLYLACVDVGTDLTGEERLLRAHDLGISAFLGESIYNFGELVGGFETSGRVASARGRRMLMMISSVVADASDTGCAGQHAV